ncbi:hypothetical protein ACU4GD_18880 [Cupriavidus basilensis]
MIVDSSALAEQAVQDIVHSCRAAAASALRAVRTVQQRRGRPADRHAERRDERTAPGRPRQAAHRRRPRDRCPRAQHSTPHRRHARQGPPTSTQADPERRRQRQHCRNGTYMSPTLIELDSHRASCSAKSSAPCCTWCAIRRDRVSTPCLIRTSTAPATA